MSKFQVGDMGYVPMGAAKRGWMSCRGQRLRIRDHRKLYRVIRHNFDPGPHYWTIGKGVKKRFIRRPHPFRRWFSIPDLRPRPDMRAEYAIYVGEDA